MSYYVTVDAFKFKSLLSPKDLEKARREFGAKLEDEEAKAWFNSSVFGYHFDHIANSMFPPVYTEGIDEYSLLMADYCCKLQFLPDAELADFIAEVIKPGTHTIIKFTGENGSKWGYLVFHKEVYEIEYVAVVDGVNIHDFIRDRMEKGEIE